MKISICINCKKHGCYNGILKSQESVLSKKYDISIIDSIEKSSDSDVLLLHSSKSPKEESKVKNKSKFNHKTRTLGPANMFVNNKFKCVANSEIMRDICIEKYGKLFKIFVVHNYPDWNFAKYNCKNNGRYLWLGNLYSNKNIFFFEFYNYCKKIGIKPTIVSLIKPQIDCEINYVESINYDDLPEFISEFEYGFGVGRSILDMALCGLKIIPIGEFKSELIREDNIGLHISSNFNSILTRTNKPIVELIENSKSIKDLILNTMTKDKLLEELECLIQS